MRLLTRLRLFSLAAALTLALPSIGHARDGGGRGGHGGGDHGGHGDRGGWHGGGGDWHGRGGWRGRGYGYGGGYFGFGYPYYGYGYPYYGYGYGYPYSYGYYRRPAYYGSVADDLGVEVQRALKRRGYYSGPLDGQIGAGSRNALRNFQAEHRLAVTGRIDDSTVRALGL